MSRGNVILKATVMLVLVWTGVWAIRSFAGSRKITAERVNREMESANFADWSGRDAPPETAEARRRDKETPQDRRAW